MIFFRNVCFFLFFLTVPSIMFAGEYITPPNDCSYILGVDLGIAGPTNLGNSAQFKLGYSTFSYHPKSNNTWRFYSGIGIAKNIIKYDSYLIQLGLSYHYFSSMRVDGNLAQGITPPHFQASYNYFIDSSQVLVEATLRKTWNQCLSPYFLLGLGIAYNHAQSYLTSVPSYLTLTPAYSNSTTVPFSYALGLGLDYLIDPKVSIGIAYRFIDLGPAGPGTGKIRSTQVSEKLKQSNLYINALAIHFNYFI